MLPLTSLVTVIELFTSQGCSSCPAADTLVRELATRPGVVALSLHVDYWNDLGWTDPYSSSANTARQSDYAARLTAGRLYTPQVVVDGAAACVGSDRRCIETALARARPKAVLELRREPDGGVRVSGPVPDGTKLVVAWVQRVARNRVPRGENAGRELAHGSVVRLLERREAAAVLAVPPGPIDRLVVLAQNDALEVVALGTLELTKE